MDPISRLNAIQAANQSKGASEVKRTNNTEQLFATNAVDKNDFYGGMVKLNNKVPVYSGPESMVNYLDYLENTNFI